MKRYLKDVPDRVLVIDWNGGFGTPIYREQLERELYLRGYVTRGEEGMIVIPIPS